MLLFFDFFFVVVVVENLSLLSQSSTNPINSFIDCTENFSSSNYNTAKLLCVTLISLPFSVVILHRRIYVKEGCVQ